ncbi:helix-turn-helix domain-containing protein [Streptomyces sp. NBC_01233]|uniref:helix-turn-helix domain-containing protein n=1 Tax=Streptomyces sp. NBC_01233 TaxID=2903787 RepID=UPI002E0DFEB2|nr:helix-turn-helix domain-containing protein [Streptomyces sp. NBC_01233]
MTISRARNERLRLALQQTGLTYDQLAADVRHIAAEAGETLRTNRSAVAHWVAGRPPSPETAAYIAEALSRRLARHLTPADLGWQVPGHGNGSDARLGLGIGPDPVDIVRRIGEADINRRKILTGAAYSVAAAALPLGLVQAAEAQERATGAKGRMVGEGDIDAVRSMLKAFTAIDERQGGLHGRSAVVQYLRSDVADLTRARFPKESVRGDALTAAAAFAFLAGWKAYDAGEHGLAQRYYLQSLGLTREADNPLHEAWVLRIMAHNGMDIARPEHTLDLADAALSLATGRAEPGMLSMFVVCRARALAVAGRGAESVAEVRRAQDLAIRGEDDVLPYWLTLSGSPRAAVASHAAKVFRALKDHPNAAKQYASAGRSYGAAAQGGLSRITALSLASLGKEQAAQGHLEQACGTWDQALTHFTGVYSDRAVKQVGSIRRQLTVFGRRGVGAASLLDERARSWQLAHA